ncbi:MAG: 4-hydroxythreonine-4-phosphate dehydrogenase PdxA [Kordiimonadaceae bacterium]|jgi:4-hydroxythreonine-4-phosphate dehydrogenase|nr:4-hydroxythreonine-4-phosphate dehydrogenase PdxA [Kordiimonadaceae bacterium]
MDEKNIRPPIAVTIGEPSGIGPEVILKSWYKRNEFELDKFFVIGSVELLQKQAEILSLNVPVQSIHAPRETEFVFNNSLPVLDLGLPHEFEFGVPNKETAPMVIGAIDKAVELITSGQARAMATAPIHKAALYSAGFTCPGHTEYLGQLSTKHTGQEYQPVMMLAADELCVVPLTIHVALKDVPGMISHKLIVQTVRTIHESMQQYFGLEFPSIVVSGLNPHAGEDNAMGTEDSEIIAPAIAALKQNGIRINGPMPADTMFHKAARDKYDVALCMYHDQALIPIKTINFDAGVNVTLGLPMVRTSPDHGTALDIAGQGLANPTSMINSIKLAERMSFNYKPIETEQDV